MTASQRIWAFERSESIPWPRQREQRTHQRRAWEVVGLELDVIAGDCCDLLRREIRGFTEIPREEVLAMASVATRAAYQGLHETRPALAERALMGELMAAQIRGGMPFGTLVQGLRELAESVLDSLGRRAAEHGATMDKDGASLLWRWMLEVLEAAGTEHQKAHPPVRFARERRAKFLESLLLGRFTRTELDSAVTEFGLNPDSRYMAFRAPLTAPEARGRIEHSLGQGGLAEIHGDDLVGVVPRRPLGCPDLLAVGQPMPLGSAALSFAQATTVLKITTALGMTGVVSISDVPIQMAVLESHEVSDMVVDRCFGRIPLRQRAVFADTLAVYLDRDRHIGEAAELLHLHPNTLRYRLRRFEELTDLSFERLGDIMTVWWALQYLRITERVFDES